MVVEGKFSIIATKEEIDEDDELADFIEKGIAS
jgi:hypothetical protein